MSHKNQLGFSLVEILITLLIIGLVSSFAYPSLQSLLKSSDRADATTLLAKLQYQQEQWRSLHDNYANLTDLQVSNRHANNTYEIAITQLEKDNYLMTATPIDTQKDDQCGTYAINKFGPVYQQSQTVYADKTCWQQ